MKRKQLLPLIVVFLLSSSASFAGAHGVGGERPTIDLFDLMSLYMIPDSGSHGELSWWTGAQPGSAIEWKTSGTEWDEKLSASVRWGEAMVTIDGKPLYVLKKYVEPVPWKIRLAGAHAGVRRIDIWPPTSLCLDIEDELRKRTISVELYKCDTNGLASIREEIYRIRFPNKEPAWLLYGYSSGSGGCGCSFTLFLYKDDADQVPYLVTNCEN